MNLIRLVSLLLTCIWTLSCTSAPSTPSETSVTSDASEVLSVSPPFDDGTIREIERRIWLDDPEPYGPGPPIVFESITANGREIIESREIIVPVGTEVNFKVIAHDYDEYTVTESVTRWTEQNEPVVKTEQRQILIRNENPDLQWQIKEPDESE